ncbi:MAG TPA: cytochrome C biogenesis protein, partial [Microbacterium sp.]|nr:cytochrome C biogenesis protein [Microbacterium sp.]
MLGLTLVAFAAGVLTVLAPCVLPLLPVIVGGTAARTRADAGIAER